MTSKLSTSKKVPKPRKSKSKKSSKKKKPIEFNIPQKEVEFTFEPRKIKGFNIPQKKYELFDFDGKKSKKKQKSKKKHGGKITYKMTGGQVVDAGYE